MKNWPIEKLGDICQLIGGGTPSKSSSVFYEGDIPWATVRDMRNDVLSDTEFRISKEAVKRSSANIIPSGNVIIATRVGLGKVCLLEQDTAINQDLRGIVPKHASDIDVRYLFWWFKSVAHLIQKEGTGATVKGVKLPFVKGLEVPLPPLPEQQRIVKILDEAFKAIAKAKENVEKNLKNASGLLGAFFQKQFLNPTKSWERKKFDEVCVLQRGFDLPTHSRHKGIFPLVSSNGITDRIDLWRVKSPGVVTGRSGTIGNVHFIEENYWPLNTALYIKEFHGNDERFVYYFLKQFDLNKYSSGTGVPTLNRNNVHSELVWVPKSISEQRSIVARLDALSAETKKLEAIYQRKLACLEELKKSLLKKAFAGEL